MKANTKLTATLTLVMTVLLCGILATPALADDRLKSQPGYVDFGDLTELGGAEPSVEISLGGAMLGFVSAAARDAEPELADALGKLRSIRISVFEIGPESMDEARVRADSVSRKLEADDWEPAVVVRSADTSVRMYMKTVGGKVAGMAVMMIEPGSDAVFMNIVGEIDPAQLGQVASQFGVDITDLN
ncbi:MAG: DUF4252 domain-containing protein [Xanthomonadales bacterium]|nr:DUF4252 domain-containing protein [Xanthomonadales bacterium]